MNNLIEKELIGHITVLMLFMFSLGNVILFLYGNKLKKENKGVNSYSLDNWMKPTTSNILFHFFAGIACLFLIHEIGDWFIQKFFAGELDAENKTYTTTLSLISGVFGGLLIGKVLEWFRKRKNIADYNIKHRNAPE